MEKVRASSDYPLAEKRPELIKTPTGKTVMEITLEKIIAGEVGAEDCRISAETLEYQAGIAESVGNPQFAGNMRRAAELTRLPDERVLAIYNALRPYRSTREELLSIADELERGYDAGINAAFIREAAEVYEKRKKLQGDK